MWVGHLGCAQHGDSSADLPWAHLYGCTELSGGIGAAWSRIASFSWWWLSAGVVGSLTYVSGRLAPVYWHYVDWEFPKAGEDNLRVQLHHIWQCPINKRKARGQVQSHLRKALSKSINIKGNYWSHCFKQSTTLALTRLDLILWDKENYSLDIQISTHIHTSTHAHEDSLNVFT